MTEMERILRRARGLFASGDAQSYDYALKAASFGRINSTSEPALSAWNWSWDVSWHRRSYGSGLTELRAFDQAIAAAGIKAIVERDVWRKPCCKPGAQRRPSPLCDSIRVTAVRR